MNATMSPVPHDSRDDLSALAWVHDELRRSLDAAHKALRRFVKETEVLGGSDIDAIDPAVLRSARSQIHQGVGALELVGQPAAAMVLRASEALVQRFVAKPHKLTSLVVDDIEHASFALLDYLMRLLASKPVSALSLFPQYRAVQESAGADRVHPADLWAVDWQWRELPGDPSAIPRPHDAATHAALEAQLLPLMRASNPLPAAARMSELCAGLGAGASQTQVATLWKLAAAVFEAQSHGLLGFDVFSKRVASRLLAQYRILERGESEVSERLAQDLLFFCAQSASPGDGRHASRLAAVRQAYALAQHVPTDYSVSVLGRFDPAVIAQARKRVGAAKEAWSAVAGGEMHRLTGLSEQFALVGESLKRLFPLGDLFATELQQAVAQTQQGGIAPAAPLAMEVATSLLYVEAALEDADFDNPAQAERVRRLAERLAAVRAGRTPDPLEAWMEELYRRVSDRQTMGSVVQELRASLSEAEKLIDQYFRKPEDRQVLIPVPNQLSAMRGVLSVLGIDQAAAALLRMRDEVDALAATEVDPERTAQTGVFDRLAGNLGALGFLIDMLSVQPQMAKSLFTYDAAAGTLEPVMGRSALSVAARAPVAPPPVEQRLIEQAQMLAFTSVRQDVPVADVSRDLERLSHEARAADQPALAATVLKAQEAIGQAEGPAGVALARGELSEALVDFVATASDPVGIDSESAAARISTPMTLDFAAAPAGADLAQDDEMREIFLEEAREVLADAVAARAEVAAASGDLTLLTLLRRAFHTLKGSSRMVGLKDFGEAAWACEQLYNMQLADPSVAPEPLLEFTDWCLGYLSGWIDDISARRPAAHDAATVIAAATRIGEAPVARSSALPDVPVPPNLPRAEAMELPATEPASEPAVLSFELDLADLDVVAPGGASLLESEYAPLDTTAAAFLDPFDPRPTEPLRSGAALESSPGELADAAAGAVDLDLEFDLPGVSQAPPVVETIAPSASMDLDLALDTPLAPSPLASIEPLAGMPVEPARASATERGGFDDDQVKVVGPLRIGIPLFNIYLNEADELSRRLTTEVAEWAMELHRPIGDTPIALAHSLAGSSATVGFTDLSHLARALEHAQARSLAIGQGTPDEARLFVDAAEEIRRLLHQFAAGFLKQPAAELMARLADHELSSARRLDAATAAAEHPPGAAASSPTAAPAEHAVATPDQARGEAQPGTESDTLEARSEPDEMANRITAFGPVRAVIDTVPEREPDAPFPRHETRLDALGLTELKPFGDLLPEAPRARVPVHSLVDADDVIDAVDAVDAELFPIFEEEADELLPQLASQLRDWVRKPGEAAHPAACMRTLHTLKGGARLAGAMRLGEMAHRLETRIERLLAHPPVGPADVETLQIHGDALAQTFDALRPGAVVAEQAAAEALGATVGPALVLPSPMTELAMLLEAAPITPVAESSWPELAAPIDVLAPATLADAALPAGNEAAGSAPARAAPASAEAPRAHMAGEPGAAPPEIDWTRFSLAAPAARKTPDRAQGAQSAVRVRAPLLDRLVNQAGEVSITRSRIATGVAQIKGSLADLTENLERLRAQLRDIEFQGEVQMSSRLEAAKAASQSFDPLEFDRFTRFQELTRMMAESVNDVATVQRSLQRTLQSAEDDLAAQARLTRDLQDDLLRTRMVEFESLSDRLYRVVRQAAKELHKQVRLDLVGGSIEVDRGVLERIGGAFEHLLRNCVTHGIESPATRQAAGKDPAGQITVSVAHEGNEVSVEFRDDGGGLDLARIRERGVALGLIGADAAADDGMLAQLIFTPGFSTADVVTELAGRGIGMDVVRSEVNALGGRIETASAPGQGTSFRLLLPLTTAVTQVVMLRAGAVTVAVPATLIEIVRRANASELAQAYASGSYLFADKALPFFWLGALLQADGRSNEVAARSAHVVVVKSAQQRIALHVDEVLGNQEVVVKNLGAQLARVPGLAGITLLASGAPALIYNPVALATLYGEQARAAMQASAAQPQQPGQDQAAAQRLAPLVLVVDDSLTVRRVTQRLLLREGYRVTLAKDGLDAIEKLAEEKPAIVLSDIEMPRMDGFDLVRNMRADARLRELPVIMITSRIAQKHRDYAAELGVDHYLGKPYSEEDLLALIRRYTSAKVEA